MFYQNNYGVMLNKAQVGEQVISKVKQQLTVMPQSYFDNQVQQSFMVFSENDQCLFIPQFFAIDILGIPRDKIVMVNEIQKVPDISFIGELRPNQVQVTQDIQKQLESYGGSILNLECAMGKCLSKDSQVITVNGPVLIQDIQIGDLLIYPDLGVSNDQLGISEVVSICQGYDDQYQVYFEDHTFFSCNSKHMVTYFDYLSGEYVDQEIQNMDPEQEYIGVKYDQELRSFTKFCFKVMNTGTLTKYYGFTLSDGKNRFFVNDFIVTHNTAISLFIAAEYQYRTLVIVNKLQLVDQWTKEINKFLGPNGNSLVTIVTIQTLCSDKFNSLELSQFGTLIIDEGHCIAAKVFVRAVMKTQFRYIMNLSATYIRKDGLTNVIKYFSGQPIIRVRIKDGQLKFKVKQIQFTSDDPKFKDIMSSKSVNGHKQPDFIKIIGHLISIKKRNELVIEQIIECISENRKILVLSERVNHIHELSSMIPQLNHIAFTAKTSQKERVNIQESKYQVVIATYSIAQEAMNIVDLDTLIMATPKSDIQQAVGRILRQKNKNEPLVIDIQDQLDSLRRRTQSRQRYYRNQDQNI